MAVLQNLRENWVAYVEWVLQFELMLYAAVVCFNVSCNLVRHSFIEMSVRPFFLNDATLWLPFVKDQTVSTDQLQLITLLHLSILCLVEAVIASLLISIASSSFKRGVREGCSSALRFIIAGYLAVTILTSVNALVKNVGILRPGYAQVCLGSESTVPLDPYSSEVYTSDDSCVVEGNKLKNHIHDGRRSFMSRHAGESFCIATYVTLYCLYRGCTLCYWNASTLFGRSANKQHSRSLTGLLRRCSLRYVAQLLFFYCMPCILVAVYVSCSRLWDHQHHPADVVGGSLLGIMAAVGMFLAVAPSIHRDYFARWCSAVADDDRQDSTRLDGAEPGDLANDCTLVGRGSSQLGAGREVEMEVEMEELG